MRSTTPSRAAATESSRTRRPPSLRLAWLLVLSLRPSPAVTPWLAVVTSDPLAPDAARLLGVAEDEALVVATPTGRLADEYALATSRYAIEQLGVRLVILLAEGGPDRWQGLQSDIAEAWQRGLPSATGLQVVPALKEGRRLTWGQPLPPPGPAAGPPLLTDPAARVKPAVVIVRGYPAATGTDRVLRQAEAHANLLSSGAGLLIDPRAGLVLTPHHVLAEAARVIVELSDGRAVSAELLGGDSGFDLALLRIPPVDQPALVLDSTAPLALGQRVFTIGHPFDDFTWSLTAGVVSALDRCYEVGHRSYDRLIQTDAAMNRGSSGGPLCNERGEVVGLAIAIYSPTQASAGLSFALPIDDALAVARHLARDGAVPFIGLTATPRADARGLSVSALARGGPAAQAGLEAGDLLLSLDGTPLRARADLSRALLACRIGSPVVAEVMRKGALRKISVTLGRRPRGTLGGR